MAQSPEEMTARMLENLPEQTGKTLAQWQAEIRKRKLAKHGEVVKLLKSEFGVTHGYANLIAHKTLASDAESMGGGDDLVDAQYAGDRAGLRPIYDSLVKAIEGFGPDVELAPKKTYVSLRRSKQFGIIQPSTKTRIDIGIQLKDKAPSGRLEASGSFNAMVSHRVRVQSVGEVDKELIDWLREAYEKA